MGSLDTVEPGVGCNLEFYIGFRERAGRSVLRTFQIKTGSSNDFKNNWLAQFDGT